MACGEPIGDGMAFCRKCGTRVAENAPETPAQTPLQQNCQPRGGNNLKRTCNNCGEPVGATVWRFAGSVGRAWQRTRQRFQSKKHLQKKHKDLLRKRNPKCLCKRLQRKHKPPLRKRNPKCLRRHPQGNFKPPSAKAKTGIPPRKTKKRLRK